MTGLTALAGAVCVMPGAVAVDATVKSPVDAPTAISPDCRETTFCEPFVDPLRSFVQVIPEELSPCQVGTPPTIPSHSPASPGCRYCTG